MYRWLYRLLPLGVVVSIAAFALGAWSIIRTANSGTEAHQAICALKLDLARRVDMAERFLHEHPEGFAGVPAATIRASVENERQTIDALSVIQCDKEGATP